jgi:F0F1-type ATP synthase assembly protein I
MKNRVIREALIFSTVAILGPIILLGGLGYILDRYFGTDKVFLFSGIGLAFVTTQLFMFRKVKEFSKISSSMAQKPEQTASGPSDETETT